MIVLGIDPGMQGALAWIEVQGGSTLAVLGIDDLPILAEGKRKAIDALALARLLRERPRPQKACIELVGARPTDSRPSAFTFGRNTGGIEALVMADGIPLSRVAPVAWRRWAGLQANAPKNASIAAALRLCPDARPWMTRHDRSDALLIALWGASHA